MTEVDALLQKTSRTMALAIPLLPEPTRTEVSVASLLFRVIGTFETATQWSIGRRIEALAQLNELLHGPPEAANEIVREWARDPPVTHPEHKELLENVPNVLRAFQDLRSDARTSIRRHIGRSADGVGMFMSRSDRPAALELGTVDDLRGYCYVVGGIAGELLTELFVLNRPKLASVADELETRAAAFGEGLRLVHILNATKLEQPEGRGHLPWRAQAGEILALAKMTLRSPQPTLTPCAPPALSPDLWPSTRSLPISRSRTWRFCATTGPVRGSLVWRSRRSPSKPPQRASHPWHLVRAPLTRHAERVAS